MFIDIKSSISSNTKDDEGKVKVSLAMRYVNQTSGEDQDPNNGIISFDFKKIFVVNYYLRTIVELAQQQQRGKAAPRESKRIELGALLPTVCKRCGGKGHLASECFNVGGSSYDLIPEPVGGDEVIEDPR